MPVTPNNMPAMLLVLMAFPGFAANTIDPVSFEQIWLSNNQRNLFKRYYYFNEQAQSGADSVYYLGIDGAPDKIIETSEGEKNALIDRINIHYQSRHALFLIDWFSAIPQPQDTEGFTYGDLVLGYTWQYEDSDSYLTLGLRQKSTPRSVIVDSVPVFNATSDATREEYSVFFHFHYRGIDIGSYYSENNRLEASALHFQLSKSERQAVETTFSYFGENPDAGLSRRYEVALDHVFHTAEHSLRSGMIAALLPDLDEFDVSNVYTHYLSPVVYGMRFTGGLYYYFDIENNERFSGAKLGVVLQLEDLENMRLGFSVQRNAFGDYTALIIPDETIFSFSISSGIGDIF